MEAITFGTLHRERFLKAIENEAYERYDLGYVAALYILTSEAYFWEMAQKYMDERGWIDIVLMLEENALSGGERILLRLAANLIGEEIVITPRDTSGLGGRYKSLWISAHRVFWNDIKPYLPLKPHEEEDHNK